MTDRGIRNNNPGNIDFDPKIAWQGSLGIETGVPSPRFIAFKTPQYGIRALAKVLLTYQNHDGCKTLREIVSRWAPGVENNTAAYIAAMCAATGFGPDDEIDLDTVATMTPVVNGFIAHECSGYVYPASVVAEGVRMAGVADAPPPPVMSHAHVQAQVAAVATGCVSFCLDKANTAAGWAPTVKGWSDSLSDYTGVPIVQHAVTAFGTVAGGLALLGLGLTVLHLRKS